MMFYVIVCCIIVCSVAASACVLFFLHSRRYVKRAFDRIDDTLEHVLNKEAFPPTTKLGEDRISKLNHKAHRILERTLSEAGQLQDEKESIQGFISDMSHQMKTPLSGISMYSELLKSEKLSDQDRQEFLERIHALSGKLQWMMNSLIKMSRLEVGAITLSPVNAEIRQTIGNSVESIISAAAKKNINIRVEDFENILLYHDKKWTAEAIANVLENAVKYSPPDSEIQIRVETLSLYTKIMITDHGIGIKKTDFNLIFKRFYRAENAKDSEGSGLGLYLVSLILEKQGGYIMVDSEPGAWTTFSLFLQNNMLANTALTKL